MVTSEDWTAQERVLEDWVRHWSSHDVDRLLSLYTDDAIYEEVARGVVLHGKDEIQAFAQGFFVGYPDVLFDLKSRFATGSQGAAEWVMRGTHTGDRPGLPATGKRIDIRGISMFEFIGGKIHRCSDYWDMATLLKQMG